MQDQTRDMIHHRIDTARLPQTPHRPIAGRAQAELRIAQQDRQSRRRAVRLGLRQVRVIVGDERDVERGRVSQPCGECEEEEL